MDEAQAQDDAFKRELRWRRYARTELRWGAINYIGMGIIAGGLLIFMVAAMSNDPEYSASSIMPGLLLGGLLGLALALLKVPNPHTYKNGPGKLPERDRHLMAEIASRRQRLKVIIATLPYLLFVITRLTFPLGPITERWLGMNLVITIFSFLPRIDTGVQCRDL